MPETYTLIVDHHEAELAVVAVDARRFVDVPRWLLPRGAGPDDVLAVSVQRDADRATITIERDADATARGRAAARAAVERLRGRDPGGDVVV